MSYPKIQKSLFSFKTFRSPDRNDLTISIYHIYHPDFTKSKFYNCKEVIGRTEDEEEEEEDKSVNQTSDFIKTLNPINDYRQIKEQYATIFELSTKLENHSRREVSNSDLKDIESLSEREVIKIWDELLTQLITKKSEIVRRLLTQLIKAIYFLENKDKIDLKDFSKLLVVIPMEFVECLRKWRQARCNGELFGVYNLGIEDYRRVEQTLCCYVPGEVSQIENIMAKEYKEKKTRNFVRTESETETETSREIENLNDTTSTERNELAIEIARQQQESQGFNVNGSVSVSGKYGVTNITANTSTGYSNNNSSSLSNTEARNHSKEITERALEKIIQKVKERRSFKMIKEFEENYKHGYDNRKGKEHITGVYRWVDKVYDNQLINYGKRLLFEIDLPEPALLYKKAIEWEKKKDEKDEDTLIPPKKLSEFGINKPSDLNEKNINEITNYYSITIDSLPDKTIKITKDLSVPGVKHNRKITTKPLSPVNISDNKYEPVKVTGSYSYTYRANSWTNSQQAFCNFTFDGEVKHSGKDYAGSKTSKTVSVNLNITPASPLPVSVTYSGCFGIHGAVTIHCNLKNSVLEKWENDAYDALSNAYNEKLEEYNKKLEEEKAKKEAEKAAKEEENTNPQINRITEQRELKRLSIEMLAHPYCYDFGKSFYDCKEYECDSACSDNEATIPQINQTKDLEDFARFSQFFETVFDWDILSYTLFPYYYNEKCNWPELLQTKNSDPIFQAFLQSGMAKVIVPVRPQYEKSVMWYLETGEINMDNDLIPDTLDNKYQSTLDDLKDRDKEEPVGEPWKTRIPSTLTIIQAQSTYFKDEEGLPCCDEESKSFGLEDSQMEGDVSKTE